MFTHISSKSQKHGILPISQQSIFVLSSLAYHGYEGVAFRDDEKPCLQADLGCGFAAPFDDKNGFYPASNDAFQLLKRKSNSGEFGPATAADRNDARGAVHPPNG